MTKLAVVFVATFVVVFGAGQLAISELGERPMCSAYDCPTPIRGAPVTYVATTTQASSADVGLARSALRRLHVAPDQNVPGYDPDRRFGSWYSIGGGCDVRDLILARDLDNDVYYPGSRCEIVAGTLRGQTVQTSTLDIDHVIPLRLAWNTGAATWSPAWRREFTNDRVNLRAEPAATNRSNGALGPEQSPPGGDECAYGVAFTIVADHYDLTVTDTRRDALARLLERCPP